MPIKLSVAEPALYRLWTFQVPSLLSIFRCLGRTVPGYQSSSQAFFVNVSQHDMFLRWGDISTSLNPQAGRPLLVDCPRLLIQYIRSYPPYWRPFLHRHALVTETHLSRSNPFILTRKFELNHSRVSCWSPSYGCIWAEGVVAVTYPRGQPVQLVAALNL
jgi:hypothetical protein